MAPYVQADQEEPHRTRRQLIQKAHPEVHTPPATTCSNSARRSPNSAATNPSQSTSSSPSYPCNSPLPSSSATLQSYLQSSSLQHTSSERPQIKTCFSQFTKSVIIWLSNRPRPTGILRCSRTCRLGCLIARRFDRIIWNITSSWVLMGLTRIYRRDLRPCFYRMFLGRRFFGPYPRSPQEYPSRPGL